MTGPVPQRIRLRPYHPGYLLAYLALGEAGQPRPAMQYGLELMRSVQPDTEVELVQEYDDICLHCEKLEPDPKGSVWGPGHTCSSSRDPEVVASVHRENDDVLRALDCSYGTVFAAETLFTILAQRLPELTHLPMQGSATIQDNYRVGLKALRTQWARRKEEGKDTRPLPTAPA